MSTVAQDLVVSVETVTETFPAAAAPRSASEACALCFDDYDAEEHLPRVLSCGHTLCTTCLQSWWGANARAPTGGDTSDKRKLLRCPHCNFEQHIVGVEVVPVNYALLPAA